MTAKRISLGCGNFGGTGSAPAFFGQGTTEDDARAIMTSPSAAELQLTADERERIGSLFQ